MHESAAADVASLIAAVAAELSAAWPARIEAGLLSPDHPRFRPGRVSADGQLD